MEQPAGRGLINETIEEAFSFRRAMTAVKQQLNGSLYCRTASLTIAQCHAVRNQSPARKVELGRLHAGLRAAGLLQQARDLLARVGSEQPQALHGRAEAERAQKQRGGDQYANPLV